MYEKRVLQSKSWKKRNTQAQTLLSELLISPICVDFLVLLPHIETQSDFLFERGT